MHHPLIDFNILKRITHLCDGHISPLTFGAPLLRSLRPLGLVPGGQPLNVLVVRAQVTAERARDLVLVRRNLRAQVTADARVERAGLVARLGHPLARLGRALRLVVVAAAVVARGLFALAGGGLVRGLAWVGGGWGKLEDKKTV